VDALVADLRACVEAAAARPPDGTAARIGEAVAALGEGEMSAETFAGLLAAAGVEGTALPERMAGINQTLNALPVAFRERLLVEYLNELYRHRGRAGA